MNSSNETTTTSIFDNSPLIAGSIALVESLFALAVNVLAIVLGTTLKNLKTLNFTLIFVILSITNAASASINLFWTQWLIFTQANEIALSWFGKKFPLQLGIALSSTSTNLMFLLAMNRFVAIVLPTKYDRVCTKRNTAMMIVVCFLVGFALVVPYFFDGCECYFYPAYFTAYCEPGICYSVTSQVGNFGVLYPVVGISLLLNLATFAKLRWRAANRVGAVGVALSNAEKIRRKQDGRFLLQSFVTALVALVENAYFHIVGDLTTRWQFFAVTVVVPMLQPTTDAILFLLVNSETRKAIGEFCCCEKTTTHEVHRLILVNRATGSLHR